MRTQSNRSVEACIASFRVADVECQSVPLAAAGFDYDSQLSSLGGKPVLEIKKGRRREKKFRWSNLSEQFSPDFPATGYGNRPSHRIADNRMRVDAKQMQSGCQNVFRRDR